MTSEISQDTQHPYWSQAPESLFTRLQSAPSGLSQDEALRRLESFGKNTIAAKREMTPLVLFLSQFKSSIVIILIVATVISAFVQDWPDAIIILAIVFGSAVLSFIQEYNAGNAAARLKAQVDAKATVLRDNRPQTISIESIVPGDVVLLSAGSLIPADGVVLEAKDLFVNQAVLTGETFPVEKKPGVAPADAALTDRVNCIFMGTSVRSGSGKALIVETGARTVFGQIAKRLTLRPPETEFERGIRRLGYLLTEFMLVMVAAIFALNVFFQKPILDSLLFSVALAVGLTPQLLPAIINVNLARGSQRMAQRGVIVRRLASIENFGSMDILCTDKTGTLTLGVVRLDHAYDIRGEESERVRRAAWLNAHFQTGIANPLDEAILASVETPVAEAVKVDEIPYDFTRKRLSVVVEEQGQRRLICKGALESVLAACTHVMDAEAQATLTPAVAQAIHNNYWAWSAQGYRVLGVAEKIAPPKTAYDRSDEADLTLLGFLLFFDPPKPGVKETIDRLRALGVRLKIITGDNKLAARHIAESLGWSAPVILTSADLDQLRDEALWVQAEQTDIFAEVDPNEKERIILALKKTRHVVGYMGDGINDAPSLHSADVSISVANAVDVAREAADFVLLKQDLAVLAEGIVEGRKTFANTLKYIFMAVSANFGNMFSVAGASLFLPYLPLLPKQILLLNFLTDLPEMTISTDNVDDAWVQTPHRWNIDFIRRFMLIFGPLSSIFDYMTFAVLLWWLRLPEASFQTGWFLESVISALLVVLVLRTRLPFFRSRPGPLLLGVSALVIVVAIALPYSPLATVFGFAPPPASALPWIAGIIALYVVSAEWVKHWFYRTWKERS